MLVSNAMVTSLASWTGSAFQGSPLAVYPAPALTLTPTPGSVNASWTVGTAGSPSYMLQRSTSPLGTDPVTLVANSTSTTFNDTSVTAGNFSQLSASTFAMCGTVNGGANYCWGLNTWGQLGNSSTTQSLSPTAVLSTGALSGTITTDISSGEGHSCALTTSSTSPSSPPVMYCWGLNTYGALGNGFSTNSTVPVQVVMAGGLAGKTITQIATGNEFTCALTSLNEIYCWGLNSLGQLGNGSAATPSLTPQAVVLSGALNGKTIANISANRDFACALASDGTVACWGSNNKGQLGNGTTANSNVPVAVSIGAYTFASISLGWGSACGLTTAPQKLYCWGSGTLGELGNNTVTDSPTPSAVVMSGALSSATGPTASSYISSLTSNAAFSCVLLTSFALPRTTTPVCWGYNDFDQIGFASSPSTLTYPVPTVAPDLGALGTKAVTALVAGPWWVCALDVAGAAFCRGYNSEGELGINSTTKTPTFAAVQLPTGAACGAAAVPSSATGCTLMGGASTRYFYKLTYTLNGFAQSTGWVQTTMQDRSLSLSTVSGATIGVSWNTSRLAPGNLTPSYTLERSTSSSGTSPTTVYSGTGTSFTESRTSNWTQVSAGSNMGCGVSAGKAYCWGWGDLGDGVSTYSTTPIAVSTTGALSGKTVEKVVVGPGVACAITTDKGFYCWGGKWMMGLGTSSGTSATPIAAFTGTGTIKDATFSGGSTCVLRTAGTVACSGWNNRGQLGNSSFADRYTVVNVTTSGVLSGRTITSLAQPQENGYTMCGIRDDSRAVCWGESMANAWGSGAAGPSSSTPVLLSPTGVTQVGIGLGFACVIASGVPRCWGENGSGQLGNNTLTSNTNFVTVQGGVGSSAILLSVGLDYACATSGASETLYCWGSNAVGQMGFLTSGLTYKTSQSVATAAGQMSGGAQMFCYMGRVGWSDEHQIRCAGKLYQPSGGAGIGTGSASSTLFGYVWESNVTTYYYRVNTTLRPAVPNSPPTVYSSWVAGTFS